MNENDEIELRNKLKELIRLDIKPNFAALGREYGCDYRTAKAKYYEEQNKEKGIDSSFEEILENIEKRDYNDMHKEVGSLTRTNEQVYIDSTDLTIEEVAKIIIDIVNGGK